MPDFRERYRLDPKPLGRGGQAVVTRAVDRHTGAALAIKQRDAGSVVAADRMRREIEVQQQLQHQNVMPIVDSDTDDHSWFVMPIAVSTLEDLPRPVATDEMLVVMRDVLAGLGAAHQRGFIHRDIKPSNILLLNDDHGRRWVVADWGVVKRPRGETTSDHTRTGVMVGTDGFAPPEAYVDSHEAGFSWDVYSIGRVVAWATTTEKLRPLVPAAAPEPWQRFARLLTASDAARRPQDLNRVLELLDAISQQVEDVPGFGPEVLEAAKNGDAAATTAVLHAASTYLDDLDFVIDDLAQIVGDGFNAFVRDEPEAARDFLKAMDRHLREGSWGRRNFDYYNVPLHWFQRVAEAAIAAGDMDLLEEACGNLFRHEPSLDRWIQADRSRAWLASLKDPVGAIVAHVLQENPSAAHYYGPMRHAHSPRLRRTLQGTTSANLDGKSGATSPETGQHRASDDVDEFGRAPKERAPQKVVRIFRHEADPTSPLVDRVSLLFESHDWEIKYGITGLASHKDGLWILGADQAIRERAAVILRPLNVEPRMDGRDPESANEKNLQIVVGQMRSQSQTKPPKIEDETEPGHFAQLLGDESIHEQARKEVPVTFDADRHFLKIGLTNKKNNHIRNLRIMMTEAGLYSAERGLLIPTPATHVGDKSRSVEIKPRHDADLYPDHTKQFFLTALNNSKLVIDGRTNGGIMYIPLQKTQNGDYWHIKLSVDADGQRRPEEVKFSWDGQHITLIG